MRTFICLSLLAVLAALAPAAPSAEPPPDADAEAAPAAPSGLSESTYIGEDDAEPPPAPPLDMSFPIHFGVVLPLSGQHAELGKTMLAGINIRLAEENADAAARGRKASTMAVWDSKSEEGAAIEGVRFLAARKVDFIVGPVMSTHVPAMRKEAERLKVVLVSPDATEPGIGREGDWVFSVLFGDDKQGALLANFVFKRLNARRAAGIINRNFPYPKSIYAEFRRVFEKLGGVIATTETYSAETDLAGDYDFSGHLEKVRASRPDVVLLPNYHEEVIAIVSQATMDGIELSFVGSDSWANETLFVASGKGLRSSYFISPFDFREDAAPAMRRFLDLLYRSNEEWGDKMAVEGYDALSLALEVRRRGYAGEKMREGFYTIRDFPLATGDITIDPRFGTFKTAYICEVSESETGLAPRILQTIYPGAMRREAERMDQ